MTAITFNTLKFVQTLRDSGVDGKQAEAIASAVSDAQAMAELATKHDLKELELTLSRDIKELELRLTLRLGALIVAAIGGVTAIMKWIG